MEETGTRREAGVETGPAEEAGAATDPHRWRRPGWIELSVALAALVVSAASLFIAQRQTEVMDRQLAASVWPIVQYATSDRGPDGEPWISMSFHNSGVGPARIRSVRVSYRDRPLSSAREFVESCCVPDGPETGGVPIVTSWINGLVLPAGGTTNFFVVRRSDRDAIYRNLDRARNEAVVRICYCSVLDECWLADPDAREPEPVDDRCEGEREEVQYY